jgi:hypothetical protein
LETTRSCWDSKVRWWSDLREELSAS